MPGGGIEDATVCASRTSVSHSVSPSTCSPHAELCTPGKEPLFLTAVCTELKTDDFPVSVLVMCLLTLCHPLTTIVSLSSGTLDALPMYSWCAIH